MTWHIILVCVKQTDQHVLIEEANVQKSNAQKYKSIFKKSSLSNKHVPKRTLHISLETSVTG